MPGMEGFGDVGSHPAKPCNSGKGSGLHSGGCGNDIFRYVFRKFLLTNTLGRGSARGRAPHRRCCINPERRRVIFSGFALPLPCSPSLNLCPAGSVLGRLFFFVGISVWCFVCLLQSLCLSKCFLCLSFSDPSCLYFWLNLHVGKSLGGKGAEVGSGRDSWWSVKWIQT